ncbi:MAG: nucleoside deaminase [Clostridia bacterium]|nr:nucleoside deaminase [Clostridia bacterium]
MEEALVQARLALEAGEVPVGAVVVHHGQVIARAHNEREALCDPTAHAEVLALRRAANVLGRRRLEGCSLYVTLEPCPMCAGAIVMSGVSSVYYGTQDEQAGCAGSVYALPEDPAFGKKIPCMGGMMAQECRAVLDSFFDSKRE